MASERTSGPTPNGGAYAVAYFQANGKPSSKMDADAVEIVEYDDTDRAIHRTYARLAGNGSRPLAS